MGRESRLQLAEKGSLLQDQNLSSFLFAANSATDLASLATEATQESAKGQTTVTSKTGDLPLCHRTKVSPSGLFPSERHKPCGSFVFMLLLLLLLLFVVVVVVVVVISKFKTCHM